jgi:hypothetical protein
MDKKERKALAQKKWREKNKARLAEYQRAYNRSYYLKNKEEILEKNTSYNKIHQKRLSEYQKQYYLENKEKIIRQANSYQKSRRQVDQLYRLKTV